MTPSGSRPGRLRATGFLAAALLAAASGFGAQARTAQGAGLDGSRDAGVWDLVFEKGNRRCRLFLRDEPAGLGYALAMPPACRHAFPSLDGVTTWRPEASQHVVFLDARGGPALDFGPAGTASLRAIVGEGDAYELIPGSTARQDAIRAAQAEDAEAATAAPAAAAPAASDGGIVVERSPSRAGAAGNKGAGAKDAAPQAPALPPLTPAEVAGHYAVLRADRDTGCMVTLEAGARVKDGQRARLAPACRDQGIVIFDPASWQLVRGELVLTAKRGHTAALSRTDDHTWASAPARGAPLVLKRL